MQFQLAMAASSIASLRDLCDLRGGDFDFLTTENTEVSEETLNAGLYESKAFRSKHRKTLTQSQTFRVSIETKR